ncbi:hypothetical protein HF908_16205 [Ralstonia pseudosolanacearum]|uniref:Uncharacterized protein n=1 Tax=Ralstonia solanacearum TaxID=305 RepID=A0AA92JU38_RALSL|nr:hypothetical protein [Ralstonia pseudosolanacearum]QOK92872.1 hypothetical protein HF908_16205 [Ralstonia pseudosolanacearum]QOK97769.1 hypothetical protein HF909_15935 [Ralstonia pseudosolanacearum]
MVEEYWLVWFFPICQRSLLRGHWPQLEWLFIDPATFAMPYALTFHKALEIVDRDRYFNACCVGGDLVLAQLLPVLREAYGEVQSDQEDWGWFAWFEHSGIKLAVDVFADDDMPQAFTVHLTARVPRFFLGAKVRDTGELEQLQHCVCNALASWPVVNLNAERVDDKYRPAKNTA